MSGSRIIALHRRSATIGADLEAVVSNGINVRHWRSKNNTIFFSLLLLTVALNTSQAMVLCQGCDGHVAIEPAGQGCCTRAWQPESSRALHSQMDAMTRGSNTRCQSCVDTPIGSGACEKPRISSTPKTRPADFAVLGASLQACGGNAATVMASVLSMAMVAPCTFLSSIVLQM